MIPPGGQGSGGGRRNGPETGKAGLGGLWYLPGEQGAELF
jgi:hypothetical protein